MKQAILVGLCQMYLGLAVAVANNLHFGNRLLLIWETLPQVLFLTCIFGYLGLLIVLKWIVPIEQPPSLLAIIIQMVLNPRSFPSQHAMFAHQHAVQQVLLLLAVVCCLWMLIGKPLAVIRRGCSGSMLELFIGQGMHTVEFVLGTVSNTASYLRLWALSLAHSQLSQVLWALTMGKAAASGNAFLGCLAFLLWLVLTLAILLCLEGLSALLHTLRLHWVEFNGKFFAGTGYAYQPFGFADTA